jgi:chemotaxis protein CheD
MWDSVTGIGGMNHYLLPLWNGEGMPTPKYGNIAIPKLIDKMINAGASENSLVAKVFGGASLLNTVRSINVPLLNVGQRNVELAFEMLDKYRIKVINYDTGGSFGRKVIMYSNGFKVFVKKINKNEKLYEKQAALN